MNTPNPYQSPQVDSQLPLGKEVVDRETLRNVAILHQRAIKALVYAQLSLLVSAVAYQVSCGPGERFSQFSAVIALATSTWSWIAASWLAFSFPAYSSPHLLALVGWMPCLSAVAPIFTTRDAADFRTRNGIEVGLFGADMSQFDLPNGEIRSS